MREIAVGSRMIGDGHPSFVAAEVGINHNGSLELAHQMVDAAVDAGADAVKFQNYRTEDFVPDRSLTYEYVSQGTTVVESQYELFKRCELPAEALAELCRHCNDRGVVFFSTPTSDEGVADLVALGAPMLKNGSDFLTNLPLIETMARTGLPTAISTGMADRSDVEDAVRAFREAGGTDLILLHCTSSYPTAAEDANLANIPWLREAFDCVVGFSDHTDGTVAAAVATALGAAMIEKHFTLDKSLAGPDHPFSADPAELRALVETVRYATASIGHGELTRGAGEAEARASYRLSCVAASDLERGHRLEAADVVFRRPGTGLPPRARAALVGRTLERSVAAGHVFDLSDVA